MSTQSKSTASHKHSSSNQDANQKEGDDVSTQSKSTASHKHSPSTERPRSRKKVPPCPFKPSSPPRPWIPSSAAIPSPPAAVASPTPAKASATALGTGLLPLPPDATIPSPPPGYEPTTGSHFRGIFPWTSELVLLPKVLHNLARFTSYASVLGGTAPQLAQLIEALMVGSKWSTMRSASAAWDAYCRDQEASAWRLINGMMDRLRTAFALAVQGDASIATTYPSLAELLAVKKVNARKGVSTRAMNKKAEAEGKPANHGAASKAREKKAAKAALAAATTASQDAPAAPAPVTTAAPALKPAVVTPAQ